jgi:hypothetical protein
MSLVSHNSYGGGHARNNSLEESMPDKKQHQRSIHFNGQQQIGCEAFATIPFCFDQTGITTILVVEHLHHFMKQQLAGAEAVQQLQISWHQKVHGNQRSKTLFPGWFPIQLF